MTLTPNSNKKTISNNCILLNLHTGTRKTKINTDRVEKINTDRVEKINKSTLKQGSSVH